MFRYFCTAVVTFLPSMILGAPDAGMDPAQTGGVACVVAKQQGNSLAIEVAHGTGPLRAIIEKAEDTLRERGYKYVFPQANAPLVHGYGVVIKTRYRTWTGRLRSSYGCGFSPNSPEQATANAVRDLRTYSWGWKPAYGYEIIRKFRY